jgi:hypothetical protein
MFFVWCLLALSIFLYFQIKNAKTKPLIILDMNKLLVFRAFSKTLETDYIPYLSDAVLLGEHYTWKRPKLDTFINYLLDNYQVAVWSSAWAKNVNLLCDFVFGNRRNELLFEWDQTQCVRVDLELEKKPLFKKQLASVWKAFPDLKDRMIIIDDSELKMQDNPPENVIITKEWTPKDQEDREDLFSLIEKIKSKRQ